MKTEQLQPTIKAAGSASDVERVVMQHTPGPWACFYKHKYDEWQVTVPMSCSSMKLALFNDGVRSENPEADARLISAAPDLLVALQRVIAISDRDHDAWDAAKAAITKAVGGA